jgi:hypothetical protein
VYIYEDENGLVSRLCGIFSTGLRMGGSALVIATAERREQLVKSLTDAGIDVRATAREGRYCMLDAHELLAHFMRDGMPNPALFASIVANVVLSARQRACGQRHSVTVFGEMVAVLWGDGQRKAALQLEQLWNEALRDSSFHLHCAYPRCIFDSVGDIESVHSMHTHVLQ